VYQVGTNKGIILYMFRALTLLIIRSST